MASLIKRGNKWYVQYLNNGRWSRVSCHTSSKKLATEILNQYKVAETVGNNDLLSAKKKNGLTLGDAIDRHLEHADGINSPKWIEDKTYFFKSSILPFFGADTLLKDITVTKVEQYRTKRIKEVSPRTVNLETTVLITVLRQAVEWGELDPKYLPRIKKYKEIKGRLRFLTNDEIKRLLETSILCDPDMEAFVRLMLYAGLRLGEALNLRWSDVDLERKMITVAPREDWSPKSRRGRIIPIPDDLFEYLDKRRQAYPESNSVVIGTGKFSLDRLQRLFMKVVKESDLPIEGDDKVTAHTLRHTYASHLVMKGTPLYTVSMLLGHSDAKTTQIYAHLAPDYLKDEVRHLSYE